MKAAIVSAVAVLGALLLPRSPAAEPAGEVFELRTYTVAPGKLDAIVARFRDHTCKLFEKHGMTNVGYWTPEDSKDARLIYMLAHASKAAADRSWKAFMADPEWKMVQTASEANGKLVTKVIRRYLEPTGYSPTVKPPAGGTHIYELRTYTATPDHLADLNVRFQDHTMKLFKKHGMINVGYWTPMIDQPGARNTLVYLLAHQDMDAAKKSWETFRADPVWVAAKKASETKAGGALTVPNGVKSLYMKPTDFSAMK